MPSKPEILRFVDTEPRTVISFANLLFSRADFSQRELFEIASKLILRVNAEDRIHLWQAATVMVRRESIDGAEQWYHLAKACLSNPNLADFEYGAVAEFLNEQRMYLNVEASQSSADGLSEFSCHVHITQLARKVPASDFQMLFDLLLTSISDESFLIRSDVASAISRLCTRSDIQDESMIPFKNQIQSIVQTLSKDNNRYVQESLDTTVYLLALP